MPASVDIETKADFARRIGVTPGRVSQLSKIGLPLRGDKVDVPAALEWMAQRDPARRVAGKVNGAIRRKPDPDADTPSDAPEDYWAARTRRERAAADKAELDLAARRGELVEVAAVRRAVLAHAKALRDAVLAFSMRASPTIAGEIAADPGALHRALDRELRALLVDLADTPEPEFTE